MIVTATCRHCKEKIDLNQDPFVDLHFPLQKRSGYFHFPSCFFAELAYHQEQLSLSSQHAPAPSHAPRPRAHRNV